MHLDPYLSPSLCYTLIVMHIFTSLHCCVKQCPYVVLSLTHTHTHTNFSANTSSVNSYNKLSDIHHPHTFLHPLSLLQTHILSEEQYDIHKEIKMPAAYEKSIQPRRRKRPQWQLCAPYSSSSSSLPTINSELQQPCYKSLYHFRRSLAVFSRILPLILYSGNPASAREQGSPGLTPDKVLSFKSHRGFVCQSLYPGIFLLCPFIYCMYAVMCRRKISQVNTAKVVCASEGVYGLLTSVCSMVFIVNWKNLNVAFSLFEINFNWNIIKCFIKKYFN